MKPEFSCIFDVLSAYVPVGKKRAPGLYAFRIGKWYKWDYASLIGGITIMRNWLIKQGAHKGDYVLTVPDKGSPEWVMIELACFMEGIIVVPVHKTYSASTLRDIFQKVNPTLWIACDSAQYHKLYQVSLDKPGYHLQYKEGFCLPVLGELLKPSVRKTEWAIESDILPGDVACIMFTSGTMGAPKGVVLTHGNIMSNVRAIRSFLPLKPGHRVISFLPFSHIFERTACTTYMSLGIDLYFSKGEEELIRDFQQVKPHFFTAVPRMLEKTYDYVIGMQLSSNLFKRVLSKWAIRIGRRYGNNESPAIAGRIKLYLARLLYFNFWHRRMGGHVRWIAVGAAALPPAIARIFGAAGIKVREGYGMTETSPVISFNRFEKGKNKIGSVGHPIEQVHVRLKKKGEEEAYGEILVKGPNVMQGYFDDPKETAKYLSDDGWLATGDIGEIDEEGFLYITDRAKDLFKTSAGKYISPAKMEQVLCSSPYIHQCLYIGANKAYPTAILVPNFRLLKPWARRHKIHWTSPQYMVHNVKIRDKIQGEIDEINRNMPNYKRIRDFILCHEEWTIEGGDFSASLKLIRKNLIAKFAKQIDKLYPEYHGKKRGV